MAQQILNVSTPNSGLGDALRDASVKSNDNFTELYDGKVDTVVGKDLSDNNLTNELVTKINDLEAEAQVNVQSDWNENDILADAYIQNKPTQLFASLGYFDYNDLTTQTTPISVPSNTQTLLTNDTLGANTDETQPPFGVTSVWNAGTANLFNFQQLSIGDTVDIRIHLKTTTSANNQLYHIDMKAGIGSASEFENRIFSAYVKTSAVDEQTFITTFYVGNADIRDYPAQLFITSVGNTATVKVVGWFVRVFRKSINVLDVVVAEDAPIDGLIYGRQDAEWVEVTGGGGGGIPDAPNDANAYVRSALAWVIGYTKSAIDTLLGNKVDKITPIVGATKTKITYNTQGQVTAGADATTFDIEDSVNKRYQTDAQRTTNDATSSIQTQLNGKVNNTGTETIAGVKTFSSNISIPATGTPLILSVSSGGSVIGLDTGTYPSLTELATVRGVTSAIQSQLDLKQPFAVATTGAVISFATPQIYNTFTSPTASNITDSLGTAKIGVVQKIYSNKSVEPTYPAGWKKISGTYTVSVANIIYCEWCEGSRVEYWITKATV
jgi:hypothetical protein